MPDFLAHVKQLGFPVKLDTNGSFPGTLGRLISKGQLDFVAMDIKVPFGKDEALACAQVDSESIRESINIILQSGVDCQFRTTRPGMLPNDADMDEMHAYVRRTARYVVREMNPSVRTVGSYGMR